MILFRHSNISVYEAVYWEAFLLNILNLLNAWWNNKSVIDIPQHCRKFAVLRALFGATAFMCSFAAVKYISISKSAVLVCTSTLYIPFLAQYFLGEQFKRFDIISLLLGFLGIVLINKTNATDSPTEFADNMIGIILSLLSGVAGAFSCITIRRLVKECDISVVPFYFSVGSTVVAALLYTTNHGSDHQTHYDFITILLLVILSILHFLGQIIYGLACKYEEAARVAMIGYLQTPLIMFIDASLFGTMIGFREILGAMLIIGSNL